VPEQLEPDPLAALARWVGEGDVGGQPAPLVEQLQGAPAGALRGDLDVDLLVGLGAPAQPVPRGHLGEQRERLRAVAVHAGRADRDLHALVAGQRGGDRVRGRGGGPRVVAGAAAHDHQPRAQLGGRGPG
jgi:hypothetical protein